MAHMEVRAYETRHTYINNCKNESYIYNKEKGNIENTIYK